MLTPASITRAGASPCYPWSTLLQQQSEFILKTLLPPNPHTPDARVRVILEEQPSLIYGAMVLNNESLLE
jgi:hypothetical protein